MTDLIQLIQLSCTMEEACTPNMAQWPQCYTKEREGGLLHTMEVIKAVLELIIQIFFCIQLFVGCLL